MVASSKGLHLSDQELTDCLKVHDMSISGVSIAVAAQLDVGLQGTASSRSQSL